MIKITSIHNPAIAVLGGKTIVMPTWTVVPDGTTLDDIDWIRPVQVKAKVLAAVAALALLMALALVLVRELGKALEMESDLFQDLEKE